MIKIEKVDVVGWEPAIRGMRNPMNSWDKSDSHPVGCLLERADPLEDVNSYYDVGKSDHELMMKLCKAGPDHRKFLRMIICYADITAPRYWWAEYDTYKVGTVANSCSTMHKIADKEFTLDDFSCEHLLSYSDCHKIGIITTGTIETLSNTLADLNLYRKLYLDTKDKRYWWQMIQLLPQSYNQKRTVMLSYEVLRNMYHARKGHKLDEWREFCKWVESLPYAELIKEGK